MTADTAGEPGIALMVVRVLDDQLPYVRGAVLAAEGCAYAMLADGIQADEEPADELVGLRWALKEARDGIEELKKDLVAVLDRAREEAA